MVLFWITTNFKGCKPYEVAVKLKAYFNVFICGSESFFSESNFLTA
jgi:hypothetical protein